MGEGSVAAERPTLGRPPKSKSGAKSSTSKPKGDDATGSEGAPKETDGPNEVTEVESKQTEAREISNSRPVRSTRNPKPQYVDSIFGIQPWSADKEEIRLLNKQIGSQEVIDLLNSQIGA